MATDPRDMRRVMSEIRGAVEGQPREALVEILSYLFKEYVVDGSGPIGGAATQLIDAQSALEGLSFAELITWLQLHVEAPELALFEVEGGRVSVRVGGRAVPLEASRAAPEPLVERPVVAAQSAPVAQPGFVAGRVGLPAAVPAPQPLAPIGSSVAGSPLAPSAPATVSSPNPASPTPSAPAAASGEPTKGPDGQDCFSWLEVD